MKKIKSIFISILLSTGVYGQDFQYSQPYSIPFYTNPAFTGNGMIDCDNSKKWLQKENFRFSGQNRNQWFGSTGGTYNSGLLAIEYSWGRLGRKKTDNLVWSFGAFANNDYLSKAQLNSLYAGVTVSADVPLGDDDKSLKFGYQLAGGNRSISRTNFDWPDEFNGAGFNYNSTTEVPAKGNNMFYGDLGSIGGLYGSKNFFLGAAWHHIGRPNISMWDGNDRLNHKLSFQGAIIISPKMTWFGRPSQQKSRIFILSTFKKQAGSQQWDCGAFIQHSRKSWSRIQLILGCWYRGLPIRQTPDQSVQNDAIVMSFGFRVHSLNIFYSYDQSISKSYVFGRTMEISAAYQFTNVRCSSRSGRPKRTIVCPDGGSGLYTWKN
jgi:type IX secretion system PorP/SprF family membrane protein